MSDTRKYPGINLLDLYAKSGIEKWNEFLTTCLANNDINELIKVLYGIQVGMRDLSIQGLNTDKVTQWFIRLQRSLEKTAKQIIQKKYPFPNDDPKYKFKTLDTKKMAEATLQAKRKRDQELNKFIKRSSF